MKPMPVRVLSAHAIVEREGQHEVYHAMPHRMKDEYGVAEHVPAPRDAARASE